MKKNYFRIYACLFLFVIAANSLRSQNKVIPYQELPTYTGSLTGSGMFFSAVMDTSNITITFEGPADRWIAFGFGKFMAPTDVFIYSCGQAANPNPLTWEDYYNDYSSPTVVDMDSAQNWNVISTATLSNGQRTVTAIRALSTGDLNDDVILTYSSTVLDLVWARGATADYTIAYHGITNRGDGIKLPWLSPPTASFAVASKTVCQGAPVTFSNTSTGGLTSYTWAFDSGSPAVSSATNVSVTYITPGTYSVSLIALNIFGSDTLRQINYITVTPTVITTASIGISGGGNPTCVGTSVIFTVTSTNGGPTPTYQWKVNNANKGSNSSAFTTTLSNSVPVTCVVTSDLGCAPTATAAAINMTIYAVAPALVSVNQTGGSNPLCIGDQVTYNATPGNGGSAPLYQWQINGLNVGANTSTFSTNTLSNGDIVTCQLTSNALCASSTLATSSAITMSVSSFLTPSVSVGLGSGTNPLCGSGIVTATASAANGGSTPNYQWLVNGIYTGGASSSSFATTITNSGDVLSCILTSGLNCASPATATSNAITFTVNPVPPIPVISASGPLSFCGGGSVILTSSGQYPATWSNGAGTPSILVTNSGNYTVSQSVNGCSSPPSAASSVTVYSLPVVSMQTISPICLSSGTFALVQGSPPGGTYSGSNVAGFIFSPDQNGPGNFEIDYSYTNGHGCSGTASISAIVDACLSIEQPINDPMVTVFPNPTAGEITIRSERQEIISVNLMDMSGRTISKQTGNRQKVLYLNISKEISGLYILGIVTAGGTIYCKISKRD